MTNEELSNSFDTLLNSYRFNFNEGEQASIYDVVLDEYEKSVYLTEAQKQIVLELYSGKSLFRESFEQTEELRRSLEELVRTVEIQSLESQNIGLNKNSKFFSLPEKLWFITYESALLEDESLGCANGSEVSVTPTKQDDYDRISKNPFRRQSKTRVLRLDAGNNIVELVSDYNIAKYKVRYLEEPTPIILVDLPDNLSIEGIKEKTECKLNTNLHSIILDRAVKLALSNRIMKK